MNEADVIDAWDKADPKAIHPLRDVSEEAYWDSGKVQAADLARLLPRKGTIIDYGCGDGRVAIPLREAGFDVIGLDSSPNMIKALMERAPEVPAFASTDLEAWWVDAIYCLAVLIHHDYADARRLVANLRNSVKPGGLMILDWPTSDSPSERQDWNQVTYWSEADQDALAKELGMRRVKNPGVPFKVFKVAKK